MTNRNLSDHYLSYFRVYNTFGAMAVVMKIWSLLFLVCISHFSFAQEEELHRCVQSHRTLTAEEKVLMRKMEQQAPNVASLRSESNVYQIPVVVHVVYRTDIEYVSYEQVQSQIEVLNRDFRRKNFDTSLTPAPFKSLAADAEIEFVLAKQDPKGNPTNGVTYTKTTSTSFAYGTDFMKYANNGGHDPWDQNKYLNLWVCNLNNGILGYVNTPLPVGSTRDGVVISYRAFGTFGNLSPYFNKGRTATHEIGHWLGLFHVWGRYGNCGSDEVNDTPPQFDETPYKPVACSVFPSLDSKCSNAPNGRMFSNFLDYSRDDCMNIFTRGQVAKMHDTLLMLRHSLFTSNNALVTPFDNDLALVELRIDTASFCNSNIVSPRLRIANKGNFPVSGYKLTVNFNETVEAINWSGTLNPGSDTVLSLAPLNTAYSENSIQATIEPAMPIIDEYMKNNSIIFNFRCPNILGIQQFVVYPNPVVDILRMKGNASKILSATFYTLEGKEAIKFENPTEIDITGILPGSYLVVFETGSQKLRHQLVVIH